MDILSFEVSLEGFKIGNIETDDFGKNNLTRGKGCGRVWA